MKKISEMSLEELQDYALALEEERETLNTLNTEKDATIEEFKALNLNLQKRNNDLLTKVEQRGTDTPEPDTEPEISCEEFAKTKLKGLI